MATWCRVGKEQQRVERQRQASVRERSGARERVSRGPSSRLRVDSKWTTSTSDKHRDISGEPAAPCANYAQGHLLPNQNFWFEVTCYYSDEKLCSFECCRVSLSCPIGPQRRGGISMVEERWPFFLESECFVVFQQKVDISYFKSSFVHSNIAVFHWVARLALNDVAVFKCWSVFF